jgi:hypothetical protein
MRLLLVHCSSSSAVTNLGFRSAGGVTPGREAAEKSKLQSSVDGLQFLAWLEAHRFAGGNADLGAGSGIAADAGFAGTDTEHSKPAQLNALACGESLFEALKYRVYRRLGLGAGQACALDHVMYDVLLNQRGTSLAKLK